MNIKDDNIIENNKHKKVFSAELMYGDADFYDHVSYITEDEEEINFITYFFECYIDALYEFYVRPDLLKYNDAFCNNRDGLLYILNQLGTLAKPLENKHGYKIELLMESDNTLKMHQLLSDCLDAIQCLCGWDLKYMEEPGSIENYSIRDITGQKVLSREDAMDLFRKMGMDVFIKE